ncbi:MAG: alpha/beta fold hydrolase [Candidatus Dormibacteria bacterium]
MSVESNEGSRAIVDFLEQYRSGRRPPGRGVVAVAYNAAGDASVTLRAEPGNRWSIQIREAGASRFLAGGVTSVHGAPETLADVIRGRQSGVEAFLQGDIRVRGNIALAMQLEGLFATRARPRRYPRSASVYAGGLETFYLEAGAGAPVILLHGLGATNASMLSTLWDLARDHRVIAPDLPGHGGSGKPIRAYHAAFFARWLRDFMDELGIDRATLVGNSMGGRVALEVGLRFPGRVRRLALLCPSPAFLQGRQYVPLVRLLRPELAAVPLFLSHRQVAAAARGMFARPERLRDEWYDSFADEFLRVFATPRGRVAFFSSARQIYLEDAHGKRGFWDRIGSLKPPAMFIWGARDPLVPAGFARHIEAALPQAQSVMLQDCGHVPQYELPDATHALLRQFMGRKVSRAA